MFASMKTKLESKRAVLAEQTQQRIEQFAQFERQQSLEEMERQQSQQSILNQEVGKYLKTVHPAFLLKSEVNRAVLNMIYSRSEGTFNMNVSMTKEMRKAYSFYHNELKIFLSLLERKGFNLEGQEELFMQSFLTKLQENNFRYLADTYGEFVSENASITEAFEAYLDTVDRGSRYEIGHLDFFSSYLNQKGIVSFSWTTSRLKRKLRQYERAHKQEFKMKELERRLQRIS
ncbi:hypothetical protein [Alkalicoccus chagannorensis]|uniref:hypothetical protein n=1 Tax=Alkalicoccus chagannorensis TaxID=427072 RepID=UPI00041B8438|nr:hypothetical protein [Alkalicoccus chagannorensis]